MHIEIIRMLLSLVFASAMVYGFVLSYMILSKNWDSSKPRFWLGILVFSYTLVLFDITARASQLANYLSIFDYSYFRLWTIIPISTWLYLKSLRANKVNFKKYDKFIFVFLVFELSVLTLSFLSKGELRDSQFLFSSNFLEWIAIGLMALTVIKIIIRERKNSASNHFNSVNGWVKVVTLTQFTLTVLWAISVIHFEIYQNNQMSALLFWLPISVLMVVFGIYVNQNPHIAFVPLTVSNGQSVKELHPQMDYYTIPVKEKRTT